MFVGSESEDNQEVEEVVGKQILTTESVVSQISASPLDLGKGR